METGRKVALIPQQLLDKLIATQHDDDAKVPRAYNDGREVVQRRLVEKINEIFNDHSIPADIRNKWVSHLEHTLENVRKTTEPVRIHIEDEKVGAPPKGGTRNIATLELLMDGRMPTHKAKVRRVLDSIASNEDLTWNDDDRVVSIRGKPIPGSDIFKIVKSLVTLGNTNTTTGFTQVGKTILKKLNDPQDVINKTNLNLLIGSPQRPLTPLHASTPHAASSRRDTSVAATPKPEMHDDDDDDDDESMMSALGGDEHDRTMKGRGFKPLKWICY